MGLRAILASIILAAGCTPWASGRVDDARERAQSLQMNALKAVLPLRDGEDIEDRVAQLRAIDMAASTLGDDGWRVRAMCARALRDFADRSASARAALESILDDTSEAFRSPIQPFGAADAWVYAKHGLGQLGDVTAWIEERVAAEPKHFRRFSATPASMDDAVVAAGRYELLQYVHRDLKSTALQVIAVHEDTRRSLEERQDARRQRFSAETRLRLGEFSAARRSALQTIDRVARCHAGLLASGKDADASEVADALLRAHDTPEARASLAMHAVRAGVSGPRHAEWLVEAIESVPRGILQIEEFAADALMKSASADAPALDPDGAAAMLDIAAASDDPSVRDNVRALRERLKQIDAERRRDVPPY